LYAGITHRLVGRYLMASGRDPLAELAAADEAFSRAVQIDEGHPSPWRGRGRSRAFRAYHRMDAGQDPTEDFAGAEADLTEAIRRDPSGSLAWAWRCELAAYRGRYWMEHGRADEAARDFTVAGEDCAESLRHRDTDGAHAARALMLTWRGRASARAGGDPLADWAAAEADLGRALALRETAADHWASRATLRAERATLRGRSRVLAAQDRGGAEADLHRALAIDPTNAAALALRGRLRPPPERRAGYE
jgi:tetratricopeptide (TPR) repeat protein